MLEDLEDLKKGKVDAVSHSLFPPFVLPLSALHSRSS
jgi:hypothetical protein